MTEREMLDQIRTQLKTAGETVWARYPLSTDFPCFKSATLAARNVLKLFPAFRRWLVMRDPCLRHVREEVLHQGYDLIIPPENGLTPLLIPSAALPLTPGGRSGSLRITPAPSGSSPYSGPVDIILVGCHAFDPKLKRVYALDTCRTERLLVEYRDGLDDGWQVDGSVPVIAVASDAQQVDGWPTDAGLGHEVHAVVTSTRFIEMGS